MAPLLETEILFSMTLVLCIMVTARSIYLSKIMMLQKNKLHTATLSLESVNKELNNLRTVEKQSNVFKENLNEAELFTNVQKSRPIFNQKVNNHKAPERYQYIRSLHQKGVDAEDIAAILTISTHEANQLVALANLSSK